MPLVSFRIGSQPIYTYSLFVALGLVVGVMDLALEGRRRGWPRELALELLVWMLVPAFLAGRLAYLAAQGYEGAMRLGLLTRPWGEGLLFPAALAGGALGVAALAALRRRPFLELAGAALPGLAFGQALGWIGAAVHGAAAGVPVAAALDVLKLRDIYGTVVPRFPVQYAAGALSIAAWLLMARRLRGDGERAACYALLTGWGLLGLERWREGRVPLLAGLSAEQLGYLALGLAGLALVAIQLRSLATRRPSRATLH
jgi:prolipoprotein diacylglyceryltransferase